MQNVVLIALVLVIVIFAVYQYNPSLFRFMSRADGFTDRNISDSTEMMNPSNNSMQGGLEQSHGFMETREGYESPGGVTELLNTLVKTVNPVPPGDMQSAGTMGNDLKNQPPKKPEEKKSSQGFADLSSYEGPANFGAAEAPAGCYPRDQLTPAELLPKDMNSIWAEQNPMGPGSLKGKNFLSAGALIGVNTVGQSLRNANLQIRSEPPNPQVPVSIFLQSTIGPDISHRTLEIN
jgi:hypothetical protein